MALTAEEVEIHGDVLETILSHVPLLHLVSASRVSKWWRYAVSSSLHYHNPPKPWLILHTQATRFPHATAAHAYDPRSGLWIKISQPSIDYVSALKSSNSSFLYMLSPSKFSFSLDPLNCNWRSVDPPLVWRTDPIVARVGDSVIIAGGACDFEDDPLAVEIYNLKTRAWCTGQSMPRNLKDSAASPWLSIATTTEKLVVADKQSGVTYWFDPETKSWSEPFVLDPCQPISSYHIGCSNNSLILVGVCRIEQAERVKVWRVDGEGLSCKEIGEMPQELVARLKSKSYENSPIDIRVTGNIVYVYNTWKAEEVVAGELMGGGGCRWWSMRNVVAREEMVGERLVFSCSEVGIEELQKAIRMKNCRFEEVNC
ncbi:UNVERIFIED_CONTAM: F-box/kelch-repeat protein [Sesamum angustifolium]|uniref:F-box/kelch-repeat protein n=1 Tax=Sesamum angustifolium TaxID=2727405 RepID=A0AAW2M8G3_9LAMI